MFGFIFSRLFIKSGEIAGLVLIILLVKNFR